MTAHALFMLATEVLGGLALFLYGMNSMSAGLRQAAGSHLRKLLGLATRNRLGGLGLGASMGLLAHSSGATLMLVGFTHAGLLTLPQAIAPVVGANIGTTFSMQLISFQLDAYSFALIALGFALQILPGSERRRHAGKAVLGFGLLLLGMLTMKEALQPHRAALQPVLALLDGSTPLGLLRGIAIAAALTAALQSSGAMIGMGFTLTAAGAITSIHELYPLVLGAHIGTCTTALLGSLGTHLEARRVALAHLVFNLLNVLLAALAQPLFLRLLAWSSDDLVRQTANLHTLVMVAGGLLAVPGSALLVRIVRLLSPSRVRPPEPSHLDPNLLEQPEKALASVIRELQRVARICRESLQLCEHVILFDLRRSGRQRLKRNEETVDEIKWTIKDYLAAVTHRHLSQRQAILIQHLNRCMIDIERIGDHIDAIGDLSERRRRVSGALFDEDALAKLFRLHRAADQVLLLVIESLNPEQTHFEAMAEAVLEARDRYRAMSHAFQREFREKVSGHQMPPIAGIYYSEYIQAFDRIVRHAKNIALAESQPQFSIKGEKLEQVEAVESGSAAPAQVNPKDFLERLHRETNIP